MFNYRPTKQINIPIREIWTKESLSAGEMVNIAMTEAKTPFVFILWNDIELNAQDVSHHLFLKLEERGDLCTTPQFYNQNGMPIPSLTLPIFPPNDIFRVIRTQHQESQTAKTFITLDFCGVYNRARFLNLGGYDPQITSEYWQKVEFGMRASMWGEHIIFNPALGVSYTDTIPVDDESITLNTTLFALKTLEVKMSKRGAYLPWKSFFWLWKEKNGWQMFKELRDWVLENRFRFKSDALLVVDNWQSYPRA